MLTLKPYLRKLGTLLLIPVMLFLTACTDMTITTNINSDETAEISIETIINKTSAESLLGVSGSDLETYVKENLEQTFQDVPSGVSYTIDNDDETITVTVSATGTYDEDGFVLDGATTDQTTTTTIPINITKMSDDTVNFKVDLSSYISGYDTEAFSSMYSSFNVEAVFPGEVTSYSDGGEVDGNTVVWDIEDITSLISQSASTFEAEGEATSSSNLMLFLAVGLIVILGVVGGVVFLLQKRKEHQDEYDDEYDDEDDPSPYRQQQYPVQQQPLYNPQQQEYYPTQYLTQYPTQQQPVNAPQQAYNPFNYPQQQPYGQQPVNAPQQPVTPPPVPQAPVNNTGQGQPKTTRPQRPQRPL